MNPQELQQFSNDCKAELIGHILPFWMGLRDARGGFIGQVTRDLVVHPDAPKGVILHARILWTFSSAYLALGNSDYLEMANHAFAFLCGAEDQKYGGVFWSMTADGQPLEVEKYTYCQAFAVYGLCAFTEASKRPEALAFAQRIVNAIEQYAAQPNGYSEAFSREWKPISNCHLSEHGLQAEKTMNTTLHLIEAYADFDRLTGDTSIHRSLGALLNCVADRIYDAIVGKLHVFFDSSMNVLGDVHSYGHDIEASWLVDHACDCYGDDILSERLSRCDDHLAETVLAVAFRGNALCNERFDNQVDETRVWWVQAEGVVGFLNAAQKAKRCHNTERAVRFQKAALQLWEYLQQHQIDNRTGGEWYAETDEDGIPKGEFDLAGPWKCPYHNSRMCLEVMRRIAILCKEESSGFGESQLK